MLQYMPYGGFRWVGASLDGLDELDETSPIGRLYEVDITYPQHLHDLHNDLPFLPDNSVPPGSKIQKLMATFDMKERYVIHYCNLQQAIKHGLIVEKVFVFIYLFIYFIYLFLLSLLFRFIECCNSNSLHG